MAAENGKEEKKQTQHAVKMSVLEEKKDTERGEKEVKAATQTLSPSFPLLQQNKGNKV